jgi:hypothetical protein
MVYYYKYYVFGHYPSSCPFFKNHHVSDTGFCLRPPSLLEHPIRQPSVDISPIWTPVIITEIKRLQRRQV